MIKIVRLIRQRFMNGQSPEISSTFPLKVIILFFIKILRGKTVTEDGCGVSAEVMQFEENED